MLFSYQRRCQRLLRDQRVQLINPEDLTRYINEARGQVAGEGQCLLSVGTFPVVSPNQVYAFHNITLTPVGLGGVLNVRTLWYNVGGGRAWITPRPWPWFSLYELNTVTAPQGPPKVWSQYGPGANGSLYISPAPDQAYTVEADCVCFPANLENDTDFELIPYLWTDAVVYYATALAMRSMQHPDTDKMFQLHREYLAVARASATPSVLPTNYAQVPNPVQTNQLGMAPQRGGQ